ncbi:MAG: GspE/PulE family protein [Helicobacteraceae bacterium]
MLNKIRLGDLLVSEGLLRPEQIDEAFEVQKNCVDKKLLGEIILELGMLDEETILRTVAKQLKIDYLEPGSFDMNFSISEKLQLSMLRKYKVIPVGENDFEYEVIFADPLDYQALDSIQRMLPAKTIKMAVTKKEEVLNLLEKVEQFESQKDILIDIRKEVAANSQISRSGDEESAVSRLVELIVETAVNSKASDIHIEPTLDKCRVRGRVDGYLKDLFIFDKDIYPPLSSKIKLLSSLDIAERRKPQDGRFSMTIKEQEYDFRISTLPINHGESIVLRILDKKAALIKLDEIGFKPANAKKFRKAMTAPYGIIFVTGPTGSGKTTTLYAGLNEIKNVTKKLITVEDPVEYQMSLIQQVQVNTKADLTFANALRSILRQDPDVIMVGESRDKETLSIAVQAALTGHLVFTTLHTNDAISAITRIVDMGVESLLIANSLVAIQAQRLVRKVCPYCAVKTHIPQSIEEKYAQHFDPERNFLRGQGCKRCNGSGYSGRTIISEVLEANEEIAELIVRGATKQEILDAALRNGFEPMFVDGINKASRGLTTVDEILRVAKD